MNRRIAKKVWSTPSNQYTKEQVERSARVLSRRVVRYRAKWRRAHRAFTRSRSEWCALALHRDYRRLFSKINRRLAAADEANRRRGWKGHAPAKDGPGGEAP